jgi:hypothetical protein
MAYPVPLLSHALWLLCGIGAAVFAATSVRGPWSLGLFLLFFGIASVIPSSAAEPAWMAALAGLVAVMGLAWPRHWILTSATCGLLAGAWGALLHAAGLGATAAWVLAAAVPAASAALAWRRPDFAPPRLRDEALLVTLGVAAVVAVAPGVLQGWRAALQLNMPVDGARPDIPGWTLVLGLGSMASGTVAAAWRRR